jgi:hypothetical protein
MFVIHEGRGGQLVRPACQEAQPGWVASMAATVALSVALPDGTGDDQSLD